MTNKFYKIFNIHSLSLQIEWQLQLVLIKIGGKTKHKDKKGKRTPYMIFNGNVYSFFISTVENKGTQLSGMLCLWKCFANAAEKGPGGHYWICFEGTLPPLLISIRKLFLSDQVSARKQQLEAILWMSLVKIFPNFCTINWSLTCTVLCSHICASKKIEIDPGEISHKVAISVQPNKLKQYWRNIAQSG